MDVSEIFGVLFRTSEPARRGAREDVSEETRAFLQRRLSRYAAFAVMLTTPILFLTLGLFVFQDGLGRLRETSFLLYALVIFVFVGIWLFCRGTARELRFLRAVDIWGIALACVLFEVRGQFLAMAHPELVVGLALTYSLVGRAVFIPSTPHRTATLALVVGIPYIVLAFAPNAIPEAIPQTLPGGVVGQALLRTALMLMFTALSTAASAVIYGLRKEAIVARKLGQYTLDEKLGQGGMGVVYRAHHALLRRPTAVKLLPPGKTGEENVARFEREVQLTASLTHPNTITIFDYGRTPDGTFYYAMELLDGAALDAIVDASGPLPPARVLHVLDQVSAALVEAHEIGLIHRDIKPANIMLCKQGGVRDVAKVVDFGLVKDMGSQSIALTHADALTGTPLYMSPECISAPEAMDARSDLYALGAVGYYLLTGQHVFSGRTVVDVCMQHLREEPVRPSVRLGAALPKDLEALLLSCLAKEPAARPHSAAELRARIRECADFGAWTVLHANDWWEHHRMRSEESAQVSDACPAPMAIALDDEREDHAATVAPRTRRPTPVAADSITP